MENHNFWNESYKKVPLYRLKCFYKDDVVFVLRHLQHQWIIQNLRVRGNFEGNHHFMRCLVEQLNQCAVAPMIRYWIESVCEELLMSPDKYVQQIVESFAAEQNSSTIQPLQFSEIDNKIRYLRVLKICHEKSFQQFEIQWKLYEYGCNTQSSEKIRGFQNNIVTSIKDVIQLMTDVLEKVIQSRNDCLSHQNSRNLSQLTEIQVWFDELTEILWSTRTLINGIQKYDETCCFAELNELHELFKTVIGSAIILESQPSEIISTEKNCPTSIRILLTLSKFIDVKDSQLDIHLFSEKEICDENSLPNNNLLNIGTSQFQVEENSLTRHLKDLKVMKVERKSKRSHPGDTKILSEKYILKYDLKFEFENIQFNASVKSWPFFVMVNQSQAPKIKALIWWDKHFPTADRSNSKASVPWESMEMLLKTIFNNETGCDLSDLNLKALHEKCSNGIIKNGEFVWSRSCVKMPKVDFSFWEWFFGNIRFVEKCLSDAWKDGRIDGFSSSKLSAKQLHNRPVGTFLLRFSDCVIGALTPVYVARDGTIKKLTPIAFKEFEIINHGPNDPEYYGIGNLISRLEECTHFWNGMSKLEAFDKYYKSVKKSKDGYVERIDAHSRFDANPSGSSSTLYSPTTQSVESGINQSIASPSVSSSTISTLSNKIPVHNGFLPHASDGFPSDTFMAPYHLANCSPAIPFEPSQLLIPSSDNSSQPGFVSSSGFVPSPSQPQSLESGNNLTSSPGFATEPPNTVPNDNTYATGFSSNISTLPSPNFSPSIPFRPSPSPVQSQSVQFQKNFTGSPGFASPPNTVPIENTYAVGFSSFIPSPYVEPLYLPNSNSLNVTQAEYNRSVLNTPVPQPHYHNYSDDPTNHYNINSNMLPINQFNYGNASIEPHNYVNNYDNGGDISMANSNANDLNVLTLNEPFNKLWSDFNKYKK